MTQASLRLLGCGPEAGHASVSLVGLNKKPLEIMPNRETRLNGHLNFLRGNPSRAWVAVLT